VHLEDVTKTVLSSFLLSLSPLPLGRMDGWMDGYCELDHLVHSYCTLKDVLTPVHVSLSMSTRERERERERRENGMKKATLDKIPSYLLIPLGLAQFESIFLPYTLG
jgi:hypothetical protein